MTSIINKKLGVNREKPRLWIEGKKLEREGFIPGLRYNLEMDVGKLKITASETGEYKVSSRKRRSSESESPIIDILRDDLAQIFHGFELLRILIGKGSIIVTPHHQELQVKRRETRFLDKMRSGESLSSFSLYHGGGVLDSAIHEGLRDIGILSHVAAAIEIESAYLESSLENNPQLWTDSSIVIESPIQSVNIRTNSDFTVDILCAGIPCTGASKAGRTKGKLEHAESHPDAGAMFYSTLKFIEQTQPCVVVLENVTEYSQTASMEVIRSVLDGLGYQIQERVLEGNDFGVLESRKRLGVVAISKGLAGFFDLSSVTPIRQKEETISEILEDIPLDSERWKTYSYLAEKEVRDKAAGKGFSRQLLLGTESACNTLNRTYHKGQSTGVFIVHPENPNLSRLLTPIEHCRAKGIPESLISGLSDTIAHEILGQSIIYPAFQAVARGLGAAMWNMVGLTPIPVEVVDTTQGLIGGEDLLPGVALLAKTGELITTPADKKEARAPLIMNETVSVLSTRGTSQCNSGRCEDIPVYWTANGNPALNATQLNLLGI